MRRPRETRGPRVASSVRSVECLVLRVCTPGSLRRAPCTRSILHAAHTLVRLTLTFAIRVGSGAALRRGVCRCVAGADLTAQRLAHRQDLVVGELRSNKPPQHLCGQ